MADPDYFAAATYAYDLPVELIAQEPVADRDRSRLLVLHADGSIGHRLFADIKQFLQPGDLLVANDTRVMRARFFPKRKRGGAAQVLLLHPGSEPHTWIAMARPGKRVRPGDVLTLGQDAAIEIIARAEGGTRVVRFAGLDAEAAMLRYGQVPLPPYIKHPPADAAQRYQTVYAAHDGSVAAPTAGLHFTSELLAQLQAAGAGWTTITLDVGAGTFRPVSVPDIRDHHMHEERYEISEPAAQAITQARARGKRIVAVGTTTLRALEDTWRCANGTIVSGNRWTSLFLHPPDRIASVDALITNFHLPRSTLLMLVCAFGGTQRVLAAYEEAARQHYRFYSFGDSMFLERPSSDVR